MTSLYYDREGNPMSLEQWATTFEDYMGNRRIGEWEQGGVRVSTVWLGIDHQFGDGPPLIFETMIFGGKYDEYQWRYATEAEAIAGHEAAIALVVRSQWWMRLLRLIAPRA